jgi:hypothetical protein
MTLKLDRIFSYEDIYQKDKKNKENQIFIDSLKELNEKS